MSRQIQILKARGLATEMAEIPEYINNGNMRDHTRNFTETVVHSEGDLTISVRHNQISENIKLENGGLDSASCNNMLDESDQSDSGSSVDTSKPTDKQTYHPPFSLLPPVTKEVITFMEAMLQYMKEMYKEESENSKTSSPPGIIKIPEDFKMGGSEKVEVYPGSHCYISKSKMAAIILSADEDPENWIKLTRAILEEVYGKDLAHLSAKGMRRSQGIYVPLYNAIYALVNDRLRLLNKRVSEHEFNKRINKICSNKRGAAKRQASTPVCSSSLKAAKLSRSAQDHLMLPHSMGDSPTERLPLQVYPWIKQQRICERQVCEGDCVCEEEEILRDSVEMVPVDIEIGNAEEVEVYPNSQCYISKSKMYEILMSADEDPDNWVKLTRAILEEVYGEDLANLSAKGTRGSQGISAQLYSALYALVNERLRARNRYISEHEFNKRINKICSNKRGSAKRAAKRSVTATVETNLQHASKIDTDDESYLE